MEPGKRYLLSAWLKGDGEIYLVVYHKDEKGGLIRPYASSGPLEVAGDRWRRYQFIHEPPEEARSASMVIPVKGTVMC